MNKVSILFLVLISPLLTIVSNAQIIHTVAGIYDNGFSGDGGQATLAELNLPDGITLDSIGNMYISDTYNDLIRKVDVSTGIITTVAGGGNGGTGDGGQATAAGLYYPEAVAFDKQGNMYIADANYNAIREVNAKTSIIVSVAGIPGTMNKGYAGDGGQATAASLDGPADVAFDKEGNMYIADFDNNVIRKVTKSTGIITTYAGNGYGAWYPLNNHWGGYSGDGGQATAAEMYDPTGVALDDSDNLYIADNLNNVIRKVCASTGIITTIAGDNALGGGISGDGGQATAARLGVPARIAFNDSGDLYVTTVAQVVRVINMKSGIISTVAGVANTHGFSGNGGPASAAELSDPWGITFDKLGNMYIADGSNGQIRKVEYNTTGINEIKQCNGISVYPNPTNRNVIFQLSEPLQGVIEMYNIEGQRMEQAIIGSEKMEINIENQADGIYFYRVIKDDGSVVGSGKLIIEK